MWSIPRGTLGVSLLVAACAGGGDLVSTSFSGDSGDSLVTALPESSGTGGPTTADTSASSADSSSTSASSLDDSSSGDPCATEELCDGVDNDCDDEVDEGCECEPDETQSCYSGPDGTEGIGSCVAGTQVCTAGTWGRCTEEVTPTDEVCNGADDDCDEASDEELDVQETCGEGICRVTVDLCVDGVASECVPGKPDPDESCNGLDDNCDGDIDEGCSCTDGEQQGCYSGPPTTQDVGLCSAGTQTCTDGGWGSCSGEVLPSGESCDGFDNDCDALTDENNPGGGMACNTGMVGVCGPGTMQCTGGGVLSCVQNIAPTAEVCDGLDNDCDTGTDEGNPGGGGACNTGLQGACAAGINQCQGGAVNCEQSVQSSVEVCDGVDNDCDGGNDEGSPGAGQGCSTGQPGVCSAGTTACNGVGGVVCNPNFGPSNEICDGVDNDCDSGTDEGNPGGGGACNTGLLGVCAAGIANCSGGAIACTQTVQSSPEACYDSVDQDCDGAADEGCCVHDECTAGDPLVNGCTPCVASVCNNDNFCCTDEWDALCMFQVMTECGSTMCSSCGHSPCAVGLALSAACEPSGCIEAICDFDSFCCTNSWDINCVGHVADICAPASC